jgi:hypothetical protein
MDAYYHHRAALTAAVMFLTFARMASGISAQPRNLVYNGDFETESAAMPPPGWTMWGAERYKVPANYARDTANLRGGKACFRILHPANTAGYIVSSPDHALRPRRGMMYAVSFWARSDRPGRSVFGFTCYESISPFVDAPSPGLFAVGVGPEWKRFDFVVREGWDLFADRSRYLLLTFKATPDEKEERTLWVDDVAVEEKPCDRPGRLVDADRLAHAPLNHRLRPGERLEIAVDASKRLGRATREAGGVSFHRVCGWTGQPYDREGRYTLLPEMERAIREMRLPMTRFYGVGDEPFGVEGGIDRVAEVCRRVGIPLTHVVLELETQDANTKIAPDVWARAARYAQKKGYGFRYWEVGNEVYSTTFQSRTPMGLAFPTPDVYVAHLKAVSAAVKKAQPDAQIGVSIDPNNQPWGSYVLKQAVGSYDFVVGHHYCGAYAYGRKLEPLVLTENYRTLDGVLRLNALIRAYNPGRSVYQYDTEWGMISSGPNGEVADDARRNANIIGTLHRAVRLIYYAREAMLRGASSWQMFSNLRSPGFGILSQQAPDKRFLLYWLYYYFNRHVGAWALDISGTAPYYAPAAGEDRNLPAGAFPGPLTPALATLDADGKTLYLVVVNGSWDRAVPCRVSLRNFRAGSAAGVALSQDDMDGDPLLQRKEDAVSALPINLSADALSCTLPPHSVVFITARRR